LNCGDGSIIVGNPNNIINGGDAGNGDGGDAGGDGGDVNPPEPIAPGNEGAVAPMASASQVQNLPYPIATRPNPRAATPDDFVMAYGLREAIQISNIDDADATQPNTDKIWMAIEDACALIDNYINGATRAGKILISSSRRRTALIIARYYLDTVRRREDVKSDYEQAITELDKARSLRDIDRPSLPWWADPCNPNRNGGVRSHRIPQVYNGVSGKGLSGHWSDSGYSEVDDWRYDRNNAEGNNDQGNHAGRRYLGGDRTLDQPIDTGGNNDGGDTP
jgi:phage gp36-like protein